MNWGDIWFLWISRYKSLDVVPFELGALTVWLKHLETRMEHFNGVCLYLFCQEESTNMIQKAVKTISNRPVWKSSNLTILMRRISYLVTTRIGSHALVFCDHIILSRSAAQCSPCVWTLCVFLRSPSLIPGLLWLVSSHMPEPALLTTTEQPC